MGPLGQLHSLTVLACAFAIHPRFASTTSSLLPKGFLLLSHCSECSPSTYRPSDILHARPLQEAFPDFRLVLVPVTAPSEHFPDYMSSSPLLGSMWPGAVSLLLPLGSSTSYRTWHRADAK